jgi:4-amino-4-deoxy-L-arabinose transferase-like glycosyltransferase
MERKRKKFSIRKNSWFSVHKEAICILIIIGFSAVFFVNLGNGQLWLADEQTYSQMAYHMFKTGDYLTPSAFGSSAVWAGKPPLTMWLMAFSYQFLGVNNISARIWIPFFATLSLVVMFYLGKKLYNWQVGLASAVVLGTFTTFYSFARHSMTDVPSIFFMLASMYFMLESQGKLKPYRFVALSGVFFGFALLTKQVQALIIPLILLIYFVATKKSIRFLFKKSLLVFLGATLLVFSPWLIYMTARFGADFWQWFLVYSGVMRVASPLEGHVGGPLYYFNYLATSENLLWVLLIPFAVGLCIYNMIAKRSKSSTLILLWVTIVFLVFTAAQTKIYYYTLPAYPAFAIAISALLYEVIKNIKTQRLSSSTLKYWKHSNS